MKITEPGRPLPPSLWAATAPQAPATPRLAESIDTDVAIVGAGYTGLSTALHLAEAGVRCCVLEAAEPGWGASGRNGGQVNPTLKYDPDEIVARFGTTQGERLNDAIHRSADDVFGLVERFKIDCDPVRKGWIQLAHSEGAVPGLHARAEKWRRRGVRTEVLDRDAVTRRVGSDAFAGGWLDPRAGAVQPLAYARGLARAALTLGARVHGGTLVRSLARENGRWTLASTQGHTVRADRVVIATNGYTGDLWPGLEQTVLAANSFIVATRPLDDDAARTILPGGETASNIQRLLLYFRRDAQGRLLMGGRGHFAEPAGTSDFDHLVQSVRLLFPQLGKVQYDYHWAGRVAITRDFLPHVHEPAAGLTVALGYNGRGVAAATAMGKHLARRIAGGADFPFPVTPVRPIPMHRLQRLYIAAGVSLYSLQDRFARR
ncbi:MAG: NAD(P)/FAD-dependent oxidoreductase [Lautropia sp.]